MNQSPPPKVAAAIATFRRDKELARLLAALAGSQTPVGPVCVADNASSPTTASVCVSAGAEWLPRSSNLGPGAAWNTAIAAALRDPAVTHVLVLDDDVVPPPDAVSTMLKVMDKTNTGAVAPLLCDDKGMLWAFPEPREVALRTAIRRVTDASSALAAMGEDPRPFCWATGACMLYRRDVFEKCGMFREDFWMLGEDLEFSMRAAAATGGCFTAKVTVPHLPPPATDARSAAVANRSKFLALLQNLSFLSFHSAHSAHLKSYLPGNLRRYLRTEGCSLGTLCDAASAFWHGAIRGQPAGTPSGARIRERAKKRPRAGQP